MYDNPFAISTNPVGSNIPTTSPNVLYHASLRVPLESVYIDSHIIHQKFLWLHSDIESYLSWNSFFLCSVKLKLTSFSN
jgi:hypothetical protein